MEVENTSSTTKNLSMSALVDGKMATEGLCGTKSFCPKAAKKAKETWNQNENKMLERAKALYYQCLFGKAAKNLSPDGLAPTNEKTYKVLCSLHP